MTSNIIHWKKHHLIDQYQKTLTINCIKQNTQDSIKITTIIQFHRRLVQRPILYQDQRPTRQMEVVLDVWNAGNVRFWLHLLVTIFVGVIIWQRVYIEISCMDLCFLLGPPVAPNLCQFVSSKTAILIRSVPNQLASIVVQGLVQIHYLQYSDMQGEQNNATELRDGYPQILQSSFQLWKPLHSVESNIHGLTDVNKIKICESLQWQNQFFVLVAWWFTIMDILPTRHKLKAQFCNLCIGESANHWGSWGHLGASVGLHNKQLTFWGFAGTLSTLCPTITNSISKYKQNPCFSMCRN